jgi:hypothetical protein
MLLERIQLDQIGLIHLGEPTQDVKIESKNPSIFRMHAAIVVTFQLCTLRVWGRNEMLLLCLYPWHGE